MPELFHFLSSFFLTIDTVIFAKFNKFPSLKWDPRLYYSPLPPLKPDPEGLELLLPWYFQLPSRFMSKYPVLCFGIQFNPLYEHPLDTETSLLRTFCFVPGEKAFVFCLFNFRKLNQPA